MRSFLLLFTLFTLVISYSNNNPCMLCQEKSKLPAWPDHVLPDGKTCLTKYVNLGKYKPTDDICLKQIKAYADICCNRNVIPPPTSTPPPTPPKWTGGTGTYPPCYICGKGNPYPGKPSAAIKAIYVGFYTCGQLYYMGINGLIQELMCKPLQDFAFTVCGCPTTPASSPTKVPSTPKSKGISAPEYPDENEHYRDTIIVIVSVSLLIAVLIIAIAERYLNSKQTNSNNHNNDAQEA